MEIAHRAAALNYFKLGRYEEALKSFKDCISVYEDLRAGKLLQESKSKKTMQITLHTEVEHESSQQSEQLEEADTDPKDRATSQSYQA